MQKETATHTFTASTIHNLQMQTSCANVVFVAEPDSGSDIRIEASYDSSASYTCEQSGDCLSIKLRHRFEKLHYNTNRDSSQITVFLPENLTFRQINLEIGAGILTMEEPAVSCEEFLLNLGAGDGKISNLSVSGNTSLEIGAGHISFEHTQVGTLEIECGVGECIYHGTVHGNLHVSCGVGSCELQLQNKESDFFYDISCSLGQVSVNQNHIQSIGTRKFSNGKEWKWTAALECGLGKISVNTSDFTTAS